VLLEVTYAGGGDLATVNRIGIVGTSHAVDLVSLVSLQLSIIGKGGKVRNVMAW
jgi:hypothetical protein